MACSIKFSNSIIQIYKQTNLYKCKSAVLPFLRYIKSREICKCLPLKKQKPFYLLLWTPLFSSTPKVEEAAKLRTSLIDQKREIKNAIQVADELFESEKYQDATAKLLVFKESGDVEVLWRLARALYKQSQAIGQTEAEKRRLVCEAYSAVSEALERDDAHWAAHKWMSVLLDARSAYDGIKARVTQLERVKHHMQRAAELNPKDATTLYMLGSWCYQIADMPWFQRKIAATIFATPPMSSFEEALQFFTKAEEIDPRFYSANLLMVGKCLMRLDRGREAVTYLRLARDHPGLSSEDDQVRKEATELLKKLKET